MKFPSPCGVCGLKSVMRVLDTIDSELFPSPCGVCGLKYRVEGLVRHVQRLVSVPLRGLWFEISPSRGRKEAKPPGFPSPCGVCGLKFKKPRDPRKALLVSVPLRGLWFEISFGACGLSYIMTCFRPLAGFVV